MHVIRTTFFCAIAALLISETGYSQPGQYNHPELDWFTIKTEHFEVHYHAGSERTANEIARIAESIYLPVTSMYQYKDDGKFHIVVKDHDDYSNGVAYFYDSKMEIWATPMDFELRGTHPWLLNVITHEFTHMVSMARAKRFGKHIPAIYFQYIGYERETRPDVLYGYPNRIVSFPIAGVAIPPWFAEGVAQFQTETVAHDYWDTHRDMILRTAVLDDKLPSYKDMSAFGHTSLGNEQVYNSGFAFVNYLANKHGRESLYRLVSNTRSPLRLSFDAAGKKSFGTKVSGEYDNWKQFLNETYEESVRDILANETSGKLIEKNGFGNIYPVWAPSGDRVAYISNQGRETFSASSLMIYQLGQEKPEVLKGPVEYGAAFSPDGNQIAYVKRKRYNRFGSSYNELFVMDLKTKKEQKLTHGARVRNPGWSPNGDEIVCATGRDGTDNLVLVDVNSGSVEMLTHFSHGEQVFKPAWSPAGDRIVFDISRGHGRDIALIDRDGGNFHYLIKDSADSRSPVFGSSGTSILFSWDKTGIFNIYRFDLNTGQSAAMTNVIGGAFMPSIHPRAGLVYSLYTSDGYKIAHLEDPSEIQPSKYLARERIPRTKPVSQLTMARNGSNGGSSNGQDPEPGKAESYKNTYGAINLLPRAVIDYNTLKLGAYFTSSEMLDKFSVLGGFALNRDYDLDLFGIVEYRRFYPTIFLEVYNQIRHEELSQLPQFYDWIRLKYNLLEADLGLELKFNPTNTFRAMYVYSRYDAKDHSKFLGQEFKTNYSYFLGSDFAFEWRFNNVPRGSTSMINPRFGRRFSIRFDRHHNKFITGFTVSEFSTLQEVYDVYNYNQITADWDEHFALPWQHSLRLRTRVGYIDRPVDSFFSFFAGGLPGLKGYPYYSIEGRKLAFGSLTYRFKISDRIGLFLPPLKFDKLYAGVFVEYGNAWDDGQIEFDQLRKDIGFQLRLDTFAFYNFPMRIFFDGAYGLDRISNRGYSYGKEWRFYFGLTFDYID